MTWHQLSIHITRDQAEPLEQLLLAQGSVSVTLQDAGDEPVFQLDRDSIPLWQQIVVTALFDSAQQASQAQMSAVAQMQAYGLSTADTRIDVLPDTDWERAWMSDFKPLQFGRRLWVCPSWSEVPDPSAVNIMLDPGLAFGSGTHPTTALCLAWLDAQPLKGKRLIDYGCGSGILAIAAALLGAEPVIAVDNDPQALIACNNNRAMNNISSESLTAWLPGEHPEEPADFLVANILSGPLQSLTPVLTRLVRPGGRILLSGVLSDQTRDIINSYQSGFRMSEPVLDKEWVRIEGTRLAN